MFAMAATLVFSAAPSGASADSEPPGPDVGWTVLDDDLVVGVPPGRDLDLSSAGRADERATEGYTLISSDLGMRSRYTLRLVKTGNWSAFTDELVRAAAELEHATGADIDVGSATSNSIARPGEIVVKLSSSSPCGTLDDVGTVGCGGPNAPDDDGADEWESGQVWLPPNAPFLGHGYATLLHELGHAVGLDHFDSHFQGRWMRMNCCSATDTHATIDRYLNGDVLGLRRLVAIGGRTAPKRAPGRIDLPLVYVDGDDALRGSWLQPPTYGSRIDQHQIQARNADTQATTVATVGPSLIGTIRGLTGGSRFQMRVRAHNSVGWGPWSQWSQVRSLFDRCTDEIIDVADTNIFCDEITWLVDQGVSGGFPDGSYRPAAPVSRQAMARFLRAHAELLEPGSTAGPFPPLEFTDVPTDHLFHEDIAWLAASSIGGGYTDGTFRPTDPVTRQAMAGFMHRMIEHLYPGGSTCFALTPDPDIGDRMPTPSSCITSQFADVGPSAAFAEEIGWIADAGITEGTVVDDDLLFRPTAPTSREAMAAFLSRLHSWVEARQHLPLTPRIERSVPLPGGDDIQPVLIGDAGPLTRVELYAAAGCSGAPVATTWAGADLGRWALQATVTSNSTTQFSARAVNVLGVSSGCSFPYAYAVW